MNDMNEINLATVEFDTLNRDVLRRLCRQHADVKPVTYYGSYVAVWEATKDDLIRGLKKAREAGKLVPARKLEAAITVKRSNPVAFLKGTGCHGTDVHIAAEIVNGKLVIYAEIDPDDEFRDYLGDAERFTTTPENLRALLDALEV